MEIKEQTEQVIHYRLDEVNQVAKKLLLSWGNNPRVICLDGELGAGKTTLVAAICKELGVDEPTSSPTFSIVNEYTGSSGSVFHLDCYRLEHLDEALAIGVEEYLDSNNWVLIEWAGVIEPILPEDVCILRLRSTDNGASRSLELSTPIA
ncbi:MAG: tRNA (adenosine(37)-N6)-threonylcarbamoyltransferase complex ATPase subunit type 1 TsaE [Bacteroidota bacterium]